MEKGRLIKIISFIVIVLIGFAGFSFLSSSNKSSNRRSQTPEIRKVETMDVVFGDQQISIRGSGVIQSQREIDVVSEVNGLVVYAKNDLKSGTYVENGEVILKVDSREAENSLLSLRADFLKVISSFLPFLKIEASENYKKWDDYFSSLSIDEPIPPLPEIDNQREKLQVSNYNVFTKFYAVQNAEISYSKHTIKAPFSGYIISGYVLAGSYIGRGQNILILNDAADLEISIPLLVSESQWIDFNKHSDVKVYLTDEKTDFVIGKISRKETHINRNSQTFNIFVELENSELNPFLLPGNYVEVEIQGKHLQNVARIPRYAMDRDSYIYTITENKLGREVVDVIAYQDEYVIIKNTFSSPLKLVKTILQKPLLGMSLEDINAEKQEDVEITSPSR